MNDLDAHFGYVCSDLSMDGGAFDAGICEWAISSALPKDDGKDSE